MEDLLKKLIEDNRKYENKGSLADYIPALSKADPSLVGLSVIDSSRIYSVGDSKHRFTIQSISKILGLMIAVEEKGEDYVFERLGYYGTNRPFNSFMELEEGPPLNPYMNGGAILVSSMIDGEGFVPYEKIRDLLGYITNREDIGYDEDAYISERETGDRNRGIFYILKNRGLIDKDEIALDNYFRQCCILVDTEDLAKIGYFFSNNCVRYDGDKRYESREMMKLINSTMISAGMYDYSGKYSRLVGLPSKSGVGGGIVASVPGKMGIGVFSPPLDDHGNSIVGYNILKDLSEELDLSIF